MNRDERRARLEGRLNDYSEFAYPTDLQSGGTWCGINTHRIVLCLLNRYDAPVSNAPDIVSRGSLIPKALTASSVESIGDQIKALDHSKYNGFRLLVLSPTHCVCHDWDRSDYSTTELENPGSLFFSSSSLRPTEIPIQREDRYRRWRASQLSATAIEVGQIPEIHLREPKVPPSESIFMVREPTHTKSICQLAVTQTEVSLNYWPAQDGWQSRHRVTWAKPL